MGKTFQGRLSHILISALLISLVSLGSCHSDERKCPEINTEAEEQRRKIKDEEEKINEQEERNIIALVASIPKVSDIIQFCAAKGQVVFVFIESRPQPNVQEYYKVCVGGPPETAGLRIIRFDVSVDPKTLKVLKIEE